MIKTSNFVPTRGKIFVTDMERGMRLSRGGIILTDDNFKAEGVKPRWSQVWRKGPDIDYLEEGEWVLVEHGRWTLRIDIEENGEEIAVWSIDPDAIILVSSGKDCPTDDTSYTLGV